MKNQTNSSNWVKDTTPFIVHQTNLETKPERLTEFITANDEFFVCNQTKTPRIDPSTYRLKIEGDAVKQSLELSYDEVLSLPSHTVLVYLECAGSQRGLFEKVMGEQIAEDHLTRWMLGGVGMAEWTGVSLRVILERAGIKPDAVDVNIQGLDVDAPEGGTNRPMPVEKALEPDTILAYRMNGELLPADHGFPLRAIVPGWIGSNSIKWVGKITVSASKIWVQRNTELYVLHGPEWPPEDYRPAKGGPITTQNIKSSLALPWEAVLTEGSQIIRGVARSPQAKIAKVEWSSDSGEHWSEARLIQPILEYAWVQFEFSWDAPVGRQTLMTRATDEAGRTQPMMMPFNEQGYMFNRVYPHPVKVLAAK